MNADEHRSSEFVGDNLQSLLGLLACAPKARRNPMAIVCARGADMRSMHLCSSAFICG
jgi:hypothetical protein